MNDLQEANYECTEKCDTCGNEQLGMMHHARDAMGWPTPVLWICHRCENPPIIVGWYRTIKTRIRLTYGKVRYHLTTTPEQRAARTKRIADARARSAARRAARSTS